MSTIELASLGDQAAALDLGRSVDVDRDRALPDHRSEPASRATRGGGIVGQLTNLHAGTENDELRKVDPLTRQACAQAVERLTNRLSLSNRMTRTRGRHTLSVALCRTGVLPPDHTSSLEH
jgi:hypothetical protein